MGQKVNPIGLRLGINRTWDSRWFANKRDYPGLLHEDLKIRKYLEERLLAAGVSRIVIERPAKKARITIHSARPGVVIGKKGADIEKLRSDLAKLTKDSDMFDRAMKGSNPEKPKSGKGPEANLIWGWGKISLMTQESKQNQETFYTARYNLAYCRLMQAMLHEEKDKKRTDGLRMAENDVKVTYTLSHAMGGPEWHGKFNELLKAIQQGQGKDPVGLPKEEAKEEPKKAAK